jgi:hypothetical protein
MILAITTKETTHNSGGGLYYALPKHTYVSLKPADNLPQDSEIKYWAEPLHDNDPNWTGELIGIADCIGVGLHESDVEIIENGAHLLDKFLYDALGLPTHTISWHVNNDNLLDDDGPECDFTKDSDLDKLLGTIEAERIGGE